MRILSAAIYTYLYCYVRMSDMAAAKRAKSRQHVDGVSLSPHQIFMTIFGR